MPPPTRSRSSAASSRPRCSGPAREAERSRRSSPLARLRAGVARVRSRAWLNVWSLIPRLASVPFSAMAARDADQGLPVMVTGAVPEQVAAYRCLARDLDQRIGRVDSTQYARERE